MAEIRHLENRHDVISFSDEGGLIWIKFWRLVQNDMSTAVMWSNLKPDVKFQYGRRLGEFNGMSSKSHLPHCRVLPPGEFNVMIPELRVTFWRVVPPCKFNGMSSQSHVSHCRVLPLGEFTVTIPEPPATLQGVRILTIVFRHIQFFFVFIMQFRLWRAAAFVSSPIHLLLL